MDDDNDARHENGVDATRGQPILDRVLAHKVVLETKLQTLSDDDRTTRADIELALATVRELLTGRLTHLPRVVAVDLNRWLERSKHLGG